MSEKRDEEEEISIDFSKVGSFFKGKKRDKQKQNIKKKPKEEHREEIKEEPKQEEEEISVNFGKIGSFFKGKKKVVEEEKKEERKPEKKDKDEEISLDFSKVTRFFKKGKKREVVEEEGEKEISFDIDNMKKIFYFFKKYIVVFLVIFTFLLSVSLRMYPAYLPITDDWARDSVHGFYKNQILNQINQQYPNLPDANKQELVEEQFNQLLKEQGDLIKQQIAETSQQFKQQFQDENGQTYLTGIDPDYWQRFVENLVDHGHIGDTIVDGMPYDNHFLAPLGRFVPEDDFHIYFEYYFFKFLHIFDRNMYPMKASFYVPIFLSALCVIPAFFIARKIGGNVGGFFAAIMVAIHPSFLSRTIGGFSDTDPYNVLFPLLITWIFLEAFEAKKIKWVIPLSVVAGLLVGVYSRTWNGWWYIFDFLLAVSGLYLVYYIVIHRNTLKTKATKIIIIDLIVLMIVFLLTSIVAVATLHSLAEFKNAFTSPISFTRIKEVAGGDIWPNVYTTVAEQNPLSIEGIIQNIGGLILFILACVGIILTILKRDRHGKIDVKYALLLVIWFIATMYASTKGVRYVMLLVPAFSIAIGVFVGVVTSYAVRFISKELKVNEHIAIVAVIIVMLLLFISPFNQAKTIAHNEVTNMNDAWVRSLTLIKTNSSENAIINSWWDFGHWFKYWADRPVTFDGTSQNTPQAHWIGKVLLTDNEDEAIAILRMLDCGGNKAFEELEKRNNDSFESVILIKRIIMLDKASARRLLLEHVNEEEADKILELTHCNPPEDFFITSEDMVGKSGVWAHFGSWNFTKADMVWKVKSKNADDGIKILQDRFGLSAEMADQYYYEIKTQDANNWIASWPSYASGIVGCSKSNDIVACDNGIKFNLTAEDAYVDTQQGKRLYPKSFSFIDKNGRFKEIKYEKDIITSNDGKELSVALMQEGDSYTSVLMTPELTSSMFTRLFYFKGVGLKHFKPFHFDRDVTGLDIYVWKVDWQGS